MKTIRKKILTEYFQDILKGNKKFELIRDEDNLEVGDTVILSEWNGISFTGQSIEVEISYIIRNKEEYGLKPGYCVFSWK